MAVIFPFETKFYEEVGLPVHFVGHPLIDALKDKHAPDPVEFRKIHGFHPDKPIIALLPGSRPQEIHKMLPVMLSSASRSSNPSLRTLAMESNTTFEFRGSTTTAPREYAG